MLSNSQQKRLNKIYTDPLYLLDKSITDEGNFLLKISGSTANVYNVLIDVNGRKIYCTCPDMKSWAKYSKCICKHCCFVLIRVLKIFVDNNINNGHPFFQELIFSPREIIRITRQFNKLIVNANDEFVDSELLAKFKSLNIDFEPETTKCNDDDCPICFDSLGNNNNVSCPTCHNVIHKLCMEKWLQSGKSTCVYCRSKIWKLYKNKKNTSIYQNLNQ